MKKMLFVLFIAAVLVGLSCQSAPAPAPTPPPESGPVIEGEVTQEKVDDAFRQVYDTYQAKLDLTNCRDHKVVWGDTLSKITRRYYGDLTNVGDAGLKNGFYFPVVMYASLDSKIVDPDLIIPGMVLHIIDLRRNLNSPESRQAIKDSLKDIAQIYRMKGKPAEEAGLIRLSNSL